MTQQIQEIQVYKNLIINFWCNAKKFVEFKLFIFEAFAVLKRVAWKDKYYFFVLYLLLFVVFCYKLWNQATVNWIILERYWHNIDVFSEISIKRKGRFVLEDWANIMTITLVLFPINIKYPKCNKNYCCLFYVLLFM